MDENADSLAGAAHARRYVETDGRVGHDWRGAHTLILTTRGRRSGKERPTPLIYGRRGDDLVVAASNGGRDDDPQWYRNVLADPAVTVQVRGDRFAARARTAKDGERDDLWRLMVSVFPAYAGYQERIEREIPVVVLERDGAGLPK
jgi:deazaflavin-dependent oxidoreductase (nitroreductase family)